MTGHVSSPEKFADKRTSKDTQPRLEFTIFIQISPTYISSLYCAIIHSDNKEVLISKINIKIKF